MSGRYPRNFNCSSSMGCAEDEEEEEEEVEEEGR
jgi:hypothetical protein